MAKPAEKDHVDRFLESLNERLGQTLGDSARLDLGTRERLDFDDPRSLHHRGANHPGAGGARARRRAPLVQLRLGSGHSMSQTPR